MTSMTSFEAPPADAALLLEAPPLAICIAAASSSSIFFCISASFCSA